MNYTINKVFKELVPILKKTPSPIQKKMNIWESMQDQLSQEGIWDEKLIESIKKEANTILGKIKTPNLIDIWYDTEASGQSDEDPENISSTILKNDIADELVNMVMDSIDEDSDDDDNLNLYYEDSDDDMLEDDMDFEKKSPKKTSKKKEDFLDIEDIDDLDEDLDFKDEDLYDDEDDY